MLLDDGVNAAIAAQLGPVPCTRRVGKTEAARVEALAVEIAKILERADLENSGQAARTIGFIVFELGLGNG